MARRRKASTRRRSGKLSKDDRLHIIIGVLLVAVVILGYYLYQESRTERVQLRIGGSGVTIEKK